MKQTDRKQNARRPYEKPCVRVIELAAQEVLGVGCKLSNSGGPATVPCGNGMTACNQPDST